MSCTDYRAVCSVNVAGSQHTNSKGSILPSKPLNLKSPQNLSSQYPFIIDTYRELKRYVSGLHKDIQLIETINKYKRGCNGVYPNIIKSCEASYQLAQNIVRTMDIFKDLSENLQDSQFEEYNHRICELTSIYIVCELRISTEAAKQEQLQIAQRIIYIMRRHLLQEEKNGDCYNIVRTLVYIPKLFDARDIMCAIFSEFIPLKPGPEVYVLPDKIYILYIIVFFRWMMMQNDDDDKQLIINFAESFMKPSVTLCSNKLYSSFLPIYTKHSLATRTILNNLKCYVDIRNASILDNSLKQDGSIVNLCDDDEDDIIFVDVSATTDFNEMFETLRLENLSCSVTNIKLEEKTVGGTVDLTCEEDPSSQTSLSLLHDKWLNDFQKLAKQYRESQTKQVNSNGGKEAIICLDSDTEEESEENSADSVQKTPLENSNQKNNLEDLFADNYPLTNTPLNCDSDLESLYTDDENDVTKISPRFLSCSLRTYEAKKSSLIQSGKKNSSGADECVKTSEEDKAYRRDSIHISSSPPDAAQDDEGTDVQDENDEQLEDEDEPQAYTFLPTTIKTREKVILPKKIQPMGPYPTYNSMSMEKDAFSHNVSRYSQEQQHQEKQQYHSDNSEAPKKQSTEIKNLFRQSQEQHYHSDNTEIKTPKKQKKRVQFNIKPLGPLVASRPQKAPLRPAIQQSKYKASDALDDYYCRGYELFPYASSIEDSLSTTSSSKQQESSTEKCKNYSSNNLIKVNHNKCSKLYKNLSVFKQKSIHLHKKLKNIKNVKINMKRIKLDKDISLTNLRKNLETKDEPLTTPNILIKKDLNLSSTELCKLKTFPKCSTTSNNDDDLIFKKPLPVSKKPLQIIKNVSTSQSQLKIQKVVSLNKNTHSLKRRYSINGDMGVLNNLDLHLKKNNEKSQNETLFNKEQISLFENKVNLETTGKTNVFDAAGNDLSKISKLLTDEINNLICETSKTINNDGSNNTEITSNTSFKETIQKKIISNINDEENKLLKTNVMQTEKVDLTDEVKLANKSKIISSVFDNNNFVNPENCTEQLKLSETVKDCSSLSNENESGLNIIEFANENEAEKEKLTDEVSSTGNNVLSNEKEIISEDEEISHISEKEAETSECMQTVALNQSSKIDIRGVKTTETPGDLVTSFSAEFLAGLPNEPSPSSIDAEENYSHNKNELDFEFENNCSTPTMCRLDLEEISENTSDMPASLPFTMSINDCEADKLLEDFNNKTEDIVGSTLSKKKIASDVLPLSENNNSIPSINESEKESPTTFENRKDFLSFHENEPNIKILKRKRVDNSLDTTEVNNFELVKKPQVDQLDNPSLKCTEINSSEQVHASNYGFESINDEETVLPCDEQKKSSRTSSKLCHDPTDERQKSKPHNLNKSNKTKETTPEETTVVQVEGSTKTCVANEHDNYDIKGHCSKDAQKSRELETSINEDQHMTVELANWKQDLEDVNKTDSSETGGVSAIFSFPKIPIISISIHTAPNNKTYFKISNRENDNQSKDAIKSQKIKCAQKDLDKNLSKKEEPADIVSDSQNGNQTKGEELQIQNPIYTQSPQEENFENEEETLNPTLEDNETADQTKECNEEDNNDIGNNEGVEDEIDNEDIDNFENEKYSHDSNSACSLPLKKRPTQANPNIDTDDSQSTNINYDQPQEIAAEVIIENTCKEKTPSSDNATLQLQEENFGTTKDDSEVCKDIPSMSTQVSGALNFENLIDDNKPSTSSVCYKNLNDPSSPFKRRIHAPIRSIGQTPIQIVAPQLKDYSPTQHSDNRNIDSQNSSAPRVTTQCVQSLPESYPATPMLSVANVEKLMDFNRFIEDLLASPDVLTIIDNANACGYYAEGQTYELERIAILEHYNIANAKGSTTATKPLYWKKSAGDTISIFNDNDNEWISLPPSTAKQLQKLSFVLSILQQQYKVTDVRQRINIALTFLIRNTSKFKNSSTNILQERVSLYSRNISDINNANHINTHPLPSTSYFRIATNNDTLNANFSANSSIENVNDFHSASYSGNQHHSELESQQEPVGVTNQNWKNAIHFSSNTTMQGNEQSTTLLSPQRLNSNNAESDQLQNQLQLQTPDRRSSSWDELANDQLYINPPCASSPQNEVIVNTNGVELLEIPQDSQNIFISITDESSTSNAEASLHKYNTRQQQQVKPSEELDVAYSSTAHTQKSYGKRSPFASNMAPYASTNFTRHNVIPTFGNQEINLQNPYRVQQHHNVHLSPSSNFSQRTKSQQNSPISIYNNKQSPPLSQQHTSPRFTSTFNTPLSQQAQSKNNEANFKEILQPYITYLIKDHEKTSKHLLQVFEEVSSSNTSNESLTNSLTKHQQEFNNLLPPLIRNPQQNHMPGFHPITDSSVGVLPPSLIRNPHQNTLTTRDSGALQVVQSFIEQSQACFDVNQQKTEEPIASALPGFATEYVNFVGNREKLRNINKNALEQQTPELTQSCVQNVQQEPEIQCLNSAKRKCQERNDKLAEDLKRKMMEFSLLKHNVQVILFEKQQKQQQGEVSQREHISVSTRKRGRPKRNLENNADTKCYCDGSGISPKRQVKSVGRVTRRQQNKSNLSTATSTIDHAYSRQRTAAKEAAKRINAAANNNFH